MEGGEGQRIRDLLVAAGIAPQPNLLIQARDVGESNSFPGVILGI
jgi:hypothetical protein